MNREFLLATAGARDEYLRRAALTARRTDWCPIAFALMGSHVHWVLEAGEQPSCSFVKPLHSGFAGWFNRTQGRLGPVFADRHRTIAIAGDSVAALLAYVHNNPVRAGVVADPADSAWTSHRAFAGFAPSPAWLDVERGLMLAGFPATRAGRRAFHDFVVSRCGQGRCAMMSAGGMRGHRTRARLEMRAPVEVGTPTVTTRRGRRIMIVPTVVPAGCFPPSGKEIAATSVISAVARSIDIPVDAMCSRSRGRAVVIGRRLAMLIWVQHLDRPAVQMARALGIAASTASELLAGASTHARRLAREIACSSIVAREVLGADGAMVDYARE